MKRTLLAAALAAVSLAGATAQTSWVYDFGTNTGTFTNANSSSTTFLPDPPPGGGSARVRVGTNGGGFTLVNPGSGSYLSGAASTGTGTTVDKFSIYDFADPTAAFSVKFDAKFTGADAGSWLFLAGAGATFSNNAALANPQVFAGLKWSYATNGGILSSNRTGSAWKLTTNASLLQDTSYMFEVVGNNGPDAIVYRDSFTLAAGTYDLWINNGLVAAGLGKAGLSNAAPINSFMFYGENSPGNAATIELDNIVYANHVVPEPSKIVLLALAAIGCVGYMQRRRIRARACEIPRRRRDRVWWHV